MFQMKKILILSYFFPPCSLTAANRIESWANYLTQFGYYPVIVTRNWDIPIQKPSDVLLSTGKKIVHQKNEKYEVYFLPYKASLRDKWFASESKIKKKLAKLLTFKDLFSELIFNKAIPYANLYDFSRKLLREDNQYVYILTSGNPYLQFKLTYQLHKETNIPWIADYRDSWTSNEMRWKQARGIDKPILRIQRVFEKKWVNTAEFFTTACDYFAEMIHRVVDIPGHIIMNGYEFPPNMPSEQKSSNKLILLYNGTVYFNQDIETLLNCIKKINNDIHSKLKIEIKFIGAAFDPNQAKRIKKASVGIEDYVIITPWMTKEEVIQEQLNADVLLMLSYGEFSKIHSSKLFEYVGLKKPTILFPNDHGVINEVLTDTGLGLICENETELMKTLTKCILQKTQNATLIDNTQIKNTENYSRKKQVENLATILDKNLTH